MRPTVLLTAAALAMVPFAASADTYLTYKRHLSPKGTEHRYTDLNGTIRVGSPDCNKNLCFSLNLTLPNESYDKIEAAAIEEATKLQNKLALRTLESIIRMEGQYKNMSSAIDRFEASVNKMVESQIAFMRLDLAKRIEKLPQDLARDDVAYSLLKERLQKDLAEVFEKKN